MNQINAFKVKHVSWIFLFFIISCKTRETNYIAYYQKVIEIDSIYRLAGQPEIAVKAYKKLFHKYEPLNQSYIQEYGTYISLADEYNKNFGGEKSLRKLINLLAPGAHHNWHKPYYPLFKKYGMDSIEVENEIFHWKDNLNKELLDSFSIAMDRDQIPRKEGDEKQFLLNDKKNFELIKWTFDKYGFPSVQKIGIEGNNGSDIHMSTILLHLGSSIDDFKEFEYLKNKVWEYVVSGDCPPEDYAAMVDRHELLVNKVKNVPYGKYIGFTDIDTTMVNKNRKGIGLPSISHGYRIASDFWKKTDK